MRIELPRETGKVHRFEAHGKTLEVKRLRRGEFFAKIYGEERGRFGDAEQIKEDIQHFFEMGALPRSKTNWY